MQCAHSARFVLHVQCLRVQPRCAAWQHDSGICVPTRSRVNSVELHNSAQTCQLSAKQGLSFLKASDTMGDIGHCVSRTHFLRDFCMCTGGGRKSRRKMPEVGNLCKCEGKPSNS